MKNGLHKRFVDELKDLYSAEKQILRALPKMSKAATTPELRDALDEHRQQTEGHVERLERVFDQIDMKPGRKKCKGMEGLIEEGSEHLEEEEGIVRDAAIIAAAQRVEHYEISAYGTASAYARRLGLDEAARLLEETLDEESQTDERLTQIAESRVNEEAFAGA